jgi:hypothetical protein
MLNFLAQLEKDFWVLTELSLLFLGVLEVFPVFRMFCGKIRADPGRAPDVVDQLLGGLLDLGHDLDCRRPIADDADSLSLPITILIPARFQLDPGR